MQARSLGPSVNFFCLRQFFVLFSPDDLGLLTEPKGGTLDSCRSGSWVVTLFLFDCERVSSWKFSLGSGITKQHPCCHVSCLISYSIVIAARLFIVSFLSMLGPKPEEMNGLPSLLRIKVLILFRHS